MSKLTTAAIALSVIAILIGGSGIFYALSIQSSISRLSSDIAAFSASVNQLYEALAIPGADYAQLLADARKDGKVVWYTSLALRDSQPVSQKFMQRFPFITVELVRKSSEDLLQLALSEARAGRQKADVWQTGLAETTQLQKEARFAKLDPKLLPELSAYKPEQKDKDGFWATIRINTFVVGFNTKLVKKAELPRSWDGFLDPKWKGKLALEAEDYNWFANLQQILGAQKALDLLKGLAANGVQLRKGHTATVELVSAGEIPIMLNANAQRVEELKARKAPVDWVPIEPIPTEIQPVVVFEKAPHPAAARVFVNWLLSLDGQSALAAEFRIPARDGVPVNPPVLVEGLKIFYADSGWVARYNELAKLWKDTFGIP